MNKGDLLIKYIREESMRRKKEENRVYKINNQRFQEIATSLLEIEPHFISENLELELDEERNNGYFLVLRLRAKKLTIKDHLIINKLYANFPEFKTYATETGVVIEFKTKNLSKDHSSEGFWSMSWDLKEIEEQILSFIKQRKIMRKVFTNHYEVKIIGPRIKDTRHILKSLFCISDKVKFSRNEYHGKTEVVMNFVIPKNYKERKDYRIKKPLTIASKTFLHVDGFDFS